jgi:hypothetical protein
LGKRFAIFQFLRTCLKSGFTRNFQFRVRAEGLEDLLDVDLHRVARVAGVAEDGAQRRVTRNADIRNMAIPDFIDFIPLCMDETCA